MHLFEKDCVVCAKGTPALSAQDARQLLVQIPGWEISADDKWLRKSYKFKDFLHALEFVNKVGVAAEQQNHHPDLELGWGYVNIRLQTHAADGLHENDFILASKIEKIQYVA